MQGAPARPKVAPQTGAAAADGDEAALKDIASAFLLTFAGLFPIVNPIEAAPFFFSMTSGLSTAERRVLARKVAINGFALLLGSMVLVPPCSSSSASACRSWASPAGWW